MACWRLLSQGLPQLIIGYSLLEGVGSALMIPPIYILVTVTFPDVNHEPATSAWSAARAAWAPPPGR